MRSSGNQSGDSRVTHVPRPQALHRLVCTKEHSQQASAGCSIRTAPEAPYASTHVSTDGRSPRTSASSSARTDARYRSGMGTTTRLSARHPHLPRSAHAHARGPGATGHLAAASSLLVDSARRPVRPILDPCLAPRGRSSRSRWQRLSWVPRAPTQPRRRLRTLRRLLRGRRQTCRGRSPEAWS